MLSNRIEELFNLLFLNVCDLCVTCVTCAIWEVTHVTRACYLCGIGDHVLYHNGHFGTVKFCPAIVAYILLFDIKTFTYNHGLRHFGFF